jgi:3-oxoacyl-[acyl-carrier protein] reductase
METLENKVAIITGASKGIGRAIARMLGEHGASVILAARSANELTAAVNELRKDGISAEGIPADVGIEDDVDALVRYVLEKNARIDILVNNAGIGYFKPLMEMSVSEFDAMWRVNMRGVFLMTKAVLPGMVKNNGGEIVNIASLAGKNTFKGGTGYAATKWALRGFAGSLMLEVRDHNIRVTTICPGSVDTAFSSTGRKGSSITQPQDVADAVVFAVTAPLRSMFSEIDLRPTRPQ